MAAIAHPAIESWSESPESWPSGSALGARRPRLFVVTPAERRRRARATTYRRRRLAVLLALLVAVSVLWLAARGAADLLGAGVAPAPALPTANPPAAHMAPMAPVAGAGVHVVRPGETYWSIARTLVGTGDVRPVVDELVAANGSATLEAGDRVALPG